MSYFTHLIKVKGEYDEIWDEKQLREYVKSKIRNNIFETFHADLELFNALNSKIEVWVYVRALPSEVNRKIVEKWLKDNITEKGLKVTEFDIKVIDSLLKRR